MNKDFKDALDNLGLGQTATISFKLNHEDASVKVVNVEVTDNEEESTFEVLNGEGEINLPE